MIDTQWSRDLLKKVWLIMKRTWSVKGNYLTLAKIKSKTEIDNSMTEYIVPLVQ